MRLWCLQQEVPNVRVMFGVAGLRTQELGVGFVTGRSPVDPRLLRAECRGVPQRAALTLTAPDQLALWPCTADTAVGV